MVNMQTQAAATITSVDESGVQIPNAILFHTWRDGEVTYEYVCGPTALRA